MRAFKPSNTQNTANAMHPTQMYANTTKKPKTAQNEFELAKTKANSKRTLISVRKSAENIKLLMKKSELLLDTIKCTDPTLTGGKITFSHFNNGASDQCLSFETLQSKFISYGDRLETEISTMVDVLLKPNVPEKLTENWKESFDRVYICIEDTLQKIHVFNKKYSEEAMILWDALQSIGFFERPVFSIYALGFLKNRQKTNKTIDDFFSQMEKWTRYLEFDAFKAANTIILSQLKRHSVILTNQPSKYSSFIESQSELFGNYDWLITVLVDNGRFPNEFQPLAALVILPNLTLLSYEFTNSNLFIELCANMIEFNGKSSRKHIKDFYMCETCRIPAAIQKALVENGMKPIDRGHDSFSDDSENEDFEAATNDIEDELDKHLLENEPDFNVWLENNSHILVRYSQMPYACFLADEISPDYSMCDESELPSELLWIQKCRNIQISSFKKYQEIFKFELLGDICTHNLTDLKSVLIKVAVTISPEKFTKWSFLRILRREEQCENELEMLYFVHCLPEIKKNLKIQKILKDIYKTIENRIMSLPNSPTKMLLLSFDYSPRPHLGETPANLIHSSIYLKFIQNLNYIPAIKYLIMLYPDTAVKHCDISQSFFKNNCKQLICPILENIGEIWDLPVFKKHPGLYVFTYKLLLKYALETASYTTQQIQNTKIRIKKEMISMNSGSKDSSTSKTPTKTSTQQNSTPIHLKPSQNQSNSSYFSLATPSPSKTSLIEYADPELELSYSRFSKIYTTFCVNLSAKSRFEIFLNDFKSELVSVCFEYPHEIRLSAFEVLYPIIDSRIDKRWMFDFKKGVESELFLNSLCETSDWKSIPSLDENIDEIIGKLFISTNYSLLSDWDLWIVTLVKKGKLDVLGYIRNKLERKYDLEKIFDRSNIALIVLFKADSVQQAENIFNTIFSARIFKPVSPKNSNPAHYFRESIIKVTLNGLKWMITLLQRRPTDELSYKRVFQGYFMILKANSEDPVVFQILRDKFYDCLRFLRSYLTPNCTQLYVDSYTFFVKQLLKILDAEKAKPKTGNYSESTNRLSVFVESTLLDWFCDCYNIVTISAELDKSIIKPEEMVEFKFLLTYVPEFSNYASLISKSKTKVPVSKTQPFPFPIPVQHFIRTKSKNYKKYFLKALNHYPSLLYNDLLMQSLQYQFAQLDKLCDHGKTEIYNLFMKIGNTKCHLYDMNLGSAGSSLSKIELWGKSYQYNEISDELPVNLPFSEEFGVFMIKFVWHIIFKQNDCSVEFDLTEDFLVLGNQMQNIYERDFPSIKKQYSEELVKFLGKQKMKKDGADKNHNKKLDPGFVYKDNDVRKVFNSLVEKMVDLAETRGYASEIDENTDSDDGMDADQICDKIDAKFKKPNTGDLDQDLTKNKKITLFMIEFFATFRKILSKSLTNSEKIIAQILSPCLMTFSLLINPSSEIEKSWLTGILHKLYQHPDYLFNFQHFVDKYHHRFHHATKNLIRFNFEHFTTANMKNVATTSESCSDTEINQIQDLANSVNKKNDDSLILKYCRMKYDDGESDSQDFTDMEEDFSKGADGDSKNSDSEDKLKDKFIYDDKHTASKFLVYEIDGLTPNVEMPKYWFAKNQSKKFTKWNMYSQITDPKYHSTNTPAGSEDLKSAKFLDAIPEKLYDLQKPRPSKPETVVSFHKPSILNHLQTVFNIKHQLTCELKNKRFEHVIWILERSVEENFVFDSPNEDLIKILHKAAVGLKDLDVIQSLNRLLQGFFKGDDKIEAMEAIGDYEGLAENYTDLEKMVSKHDDKKRPLPVQIVEKFSTACYSAFKNLWYFRLVL